MTTTPIGADVAHRRAIDAALRFAVEVTVDHEHPRNGRIVNLAVLERDLDVDMVFATAPYVPPPCEGPTHPDALYGHVLGTGAAYLTVFPCGSSILMCAGWVKARRNENPKSLCLCNAGCQQHHESRSINFISLD